MRKKTKRMLSLLLVLCLCIPLWGAIPASAYTEPSGISKSYKSTDGKTVGNMSNVENPDPIYTVPEGYEFITQNILVTYLYEPKTDETKPVSHEPYIEGVGEGKVNPNGEMSRAQASMIIYRLDGEPSYNAGESFTDVSNGAWYYDAVMYLQSTGVVTGYGDGRFGPNDTITRAQLATVLANYKGLDISKPGNASFSDVPADKWYANAVTVLADLGWIQGYTPDTFGPNDKVTRVQAVTMMNRMLGRSLPNSEVPASLNNPYTDISTTHWGYGEIIEASVKHESLWHDQRPEAELKFKVTENFIDRAGNKTFDSKTYTIAHKGIPEPAFTVHPEYTYVGYEAVIDNMYQKAGSNLGTYHGAVGWNTYGAYRKASAGMGLDKGNITTGDLIEFHVGIENFTELAKESGIFKMYYQDHGFLPDAPALNARMEIKLDNYYEFNEHTATEKPANYVGKRMKLVSVEGDYESYDYDEKKAVVTVFFGDIPIGGKCVLTLTCEVLPMPGVSESMLRFTPQYLTDNIAMTSPYLTPMIYVVPAPTGHIYNQNIRYDDWGLGAGHGDYTFKIVD